MHIKINKVETILKTFPFNIEEVFFERGEYKPTRPYHRLDCPDWVNVLPITQEGKVILIRQPRIGEEKDILVTPGGVANKNEKDLTISALRELEEETGFTSQTILPLLSVNPNPAIMKNKIHFFLAKNCYLNPQRKHFPDEGEFISLEFVDIHELDQMVRTSRINHALSALCIMLAQKYLTKS